MIRVVGTRSILEESHARDHCIFDRGVVDGRPSRARQEDRRGHPELSARLYVCMRVLGEGYTIQQDEELSFLQRLTLTNPLYI